MSYTEVPGARVPIRMWTALSGVEDGGELTVDFGEPVKITDTSVELTITTDGFPRDRHRPHGPGPGHARGPGAQRSRRATSVAQ